MAKEEVKVADITKVSAENIEEDNQQMAQL